MAATPSVPLIDIAPFLNGSETDKRRVAKQLDEACRTIGFLVIEGHGVSAELIARMHAVSREYFALPYWEKMRHKMPPDRYRGYTPLGGEGLAYSLDEPTPPDLKESFSMGPFDHPFDEYHFGPAGARFFAPNIWPDRPAGMRGFWEAYFAEMERLAADLMRIFAVALGVEEDFFADKIDKHITNHSKTSLLFFHQPNYDAVIECIPTCTGPANPPRYGRTTSGEHVTMKITKHRSPDLDKQAAG